MSSFGSMFCRAQVSPGRTHAWAYGRKNVPFDLRWGTGSLERHFSLDCRHAVFLSQIGQDKGYPEIPPGTCLVSISPVRQSLLVQMHPPPPSRVRLLNSILIREPVAALLVKPQSRSRRDVLVADVHVQGETRPD